MRGHIRVVATQLKPLFNIIKEKNGIRVEGYLSFTLDFILSAIQGSHEILVTDEIGTEISPGNWTGCVGMLHRNEADIFVGHFGAVPHLFDYVGYSNGFETVTLSTLSGPPAKLHANTVSLFSAIDISMWIGMISSWILISTLYWVFIPLEGKYLGLSLPRDTLVECFMTYYGLLFQRGFENLPVTPSLRLVASGWLILVIILSTDLAGTFSSKLAVTDSPERIDRIQDILKYPKLKPYITSGICLDTQLMQADDPELQAVWQQVQHYDGVQPNDVFFKGNIMNEVSRGEAVALNFKEPVLGYLVSFECKKKKKPYYVAKEPFLSMPTIFMYSKHLRADYVEAINRMAIEHAATGYGLLDWRLNNQYALPCFEMAFLKEGHKALTIRDLKQIFVILVIGNLLSTTLLLLEIFSKIYYSMISCNCAKVSKH